MWASAALLTTLVLAPEPIGQIKLTNDRVCHGPLGWERKDTRNPKLFPGDLYILVFDVEGLVVSPTGRVNYTTNVELRDKNGKVVFTDDPKDFEDIAGLGGRRVSANAQMAIGIDSAVGTYTIKVTVTDRATKPNATATLTRTFDVVPTELGFVRLLIESPAGPKVVFPAPAIAVPGQIYVVNFSPVGFKLDPKTMQPILFAEMRVLDETGKAVLEKPFTGGVDAVGEMYRKIVPMQFMLTLNRPGKFRIVLKITDQIVKKSAEQTLDFQVVEAK